MSVRRRGKRSYEVRVRPFPSRYAPTREAAQKLELDLMLRRSMGDLYEPPSITLGDAIAEHLERKKAVGGRRGKLRPRTVEFNERSAKLWTSNEQLAATRLPALPRRDIEDMIVARAKEHPRSAKNELEFLKAVLRGARARGHRLDPLLLEIPTIGHEARSGRAITVDELYELASWFPEHVKRLVLLAGQVGARQHFWFSLTTDMLDLDHRALEVPQALAKNRREHRIQLTPVEVKLFREQLLARAGSTRLVFPTITGKQWTRSGFRERAWVPALEAAELDALEHDRDPTPFQGFMFHLLRHTAGSLMALAGMEPPVAAERLGHTDGGALYLRTYRHLYEQERKREVAKLGRLVERELRKAEESRG
jgi:integrase